MKSSHLWQSGLLSLVFWVATPAYLFSQTAIITGTVTNQEGRPLELVEVYCRGFITHTSADGKYRLEVPAMKNSWIYFYQFGYRKDSLKVDLQSNKEYYFKTILKLLAEELDEVQVIEEKSRFTNTTVIDVKALDMLAGPVTGVEGLIRLLPGVTSRNEMSSQYNVRGGNFDENLVYVNGIEIYRPFLVRNGQQEGLSFINPDMVGNIEFSAGGFDARYGDRMASVLDITYRKPEKFGLRSEASLMGGSLTVDAIGLKNRFTALSSIRYRTNELLLGSLDTDADFRPRFTDAQVYLTYSISDRLELSYLGNYSRNIYKVIPSIRTTNFGTVQQSLRLTVFFDGMENYDFITRFSALAADFRPNKKLTMRWAVSAFQTTEQEFFDIAGAYRLAELDNNLGSDQFGDIRFIRGVGGFQNYARNLLDAIVVNAQYTATYIAGRGTWGWGLRWQAEDIIDRYKEWETIDSAGYNLPHFRRYIFRADTLGNVFVDTVEPGGLFLFESFDSRAAVFSQRLMGYGEYTTSLKLASGDLYYTAGLRFNYWDLNNQLLVIPRFTVKYKPSGPKNRIYRLSLGAYHQPAFYREMRDIRGNVNTRLRAQESYHLVTGLDQVVTIWDRPFRIVTEYYFKYLRNLVTYDLENVRLRYSARNDADGFATGLDFRINGQFVKGIESWFSASVMTVRERLRDKPELGYLPRPTDQLFNASIYFQDYLPKDPTWRVGLTLSFGTGIPFNPPQFERTATTYRIPPYRRVDVAFYKVLKEEGKPTKYRAFNALKSAWAGVEVFNLLGIRNTISYLWIKDINAANPDLSTGRQFGVPNYLTNRLINVKAVVRI